MLNRRLRARCNPFRSLAFSLSSSWIRELSFPVSYSSRRCSKSRTYAALRSRVVLCDRRFLMRLCEMRNSGSLFIQRRTGCG